METSVLITPIGYIQTDFAEKFGVPRQSGRAPSVLARIVFNPDFQSEDFFRNIEEFSHLWLLFDFSLTRQAGYSPTVRPPRLGGNKRVGVFASRSPFRPNHIGLSCVKLEKVLKNEKGNVSLLVSGADMVDGTPIFDVKPYVPPADCIPNAKGGYADKHTAHKLKVNFPPTLLKEFPEEKRAGLIESLADDPRPSYQQDGAREYGMIFANRNVKFTVYGDVLTVINVE